MVRKMVRQWAQKELAPNVVRMEKGEITPYDIMRSLLKTFGMDEMVRTAFANMKPDSPMEKPGGMGGDAAMSAIVAIELSRIKAPALRWPLARRWGWPAARLRLKGRLRKSRNTRCRY